MLIDDLFNKCPDIYFFKVVLDNKPYVFLTLETSLGMKSILATYPKSVNLHLICPVSPDFPTDRIFLDLALHKQGFAFAETRTIYKPNDFNTFYEDYLIAKISQLPQ